MIDFLHAVVDAYCFHCKSMSRIKSPELERMLNGTVIRVGVCSKCRHRISAMLSKDELDRLRLVEGLL